MKCLITGDEAAASFWQFRFLGFARSAENLSEKKLAYHLWLVNADDTSSFFKRFGFVLFRACVSAALCHITMLSVADSHRGFIFVCHVIVNIRLSINSTVSLLNYDEISTLPSSKFIMDKNEICLGTTIDILNFSS